MRAITPTIELEGLNILTEDIIVLLREDDVILYNVLYYTIQNVIFFLKIGEKNTEKFRFYLQNEFNE